MTKIIGSGLAILLLFIQCQLWMMSGGILDVIHLHTDIQQIESKNQVLAEVNHGLIMSIEHLRGGDHAVEAQARNELGIIKKDEVFYQVVGD